MNINFQIKVAYKTEKKNKEQKKKKKLLMNYF